MAAKTRIQQVWRNCTYQPPLITGYDEYGDPHIMSHYVVVNGDELGSHLICHPGSNILFSTNTPGGYWDWEEYASSSPYAPNSGVCSHFWINVGFTSYKLVCKHCNADAPSYITSESKDEA